MLSIYTEQTPNPNSLKFVLTRMLYADGGAEFTKELAQNHSAFATKIFELGYVRLVFISKNFVSITQDGSTRKQNGRLREPASQLGITQNVQHKKW